MSARPRVLLLGDSIRMSYQPHVADLLTDRAEVTGPADNCQYSLYTLSSLNRWITELGIPDVVHWNNGIHDVGHNPARYPVQIPLEMYRANIELILEQLLAMTPKVIWATSTPVHPDFPLKDNAWSWRNDEIDAYNAAALELMSSRGIAVNDLHALVLSDIPRYLSEDQLHLSEEGQKACAEKAAESIIAQLEAE